jgi:hypothetical protein
MENNKWNNRNRRDYASDRDERRGNERRVDEDSYRGAYRLDTTSDHRNQTTWDGFDRGNSNRGQQSNYNQDYNRDYNRNYNNDYNNDYNRNYNSSEQSNRHEGNRGGGYNRDFDRDSPDWNERSQQYQSSYDDGSGRHDSVRSRIEDRDRYGSGNFISNYSPDNYGGSRGENYGNMAGSLSFGYDGIGNADHDQNRHYDPQSGRHHSYHGNYESRRPDRDRFNDSRNDPNFSNDDWI